MHKNKKQQVSPSMEEASVPPWRCSSCFCKSWNGGWLERCYYPTKPFWFGVRTCSTQRNWSSVICTWIWAARARACSGSSDFADIRRAFWSASSEQLQRSLFKEEGRLKAIGTREAGLRLYRWNSRKPNFALQITTYNVFKVSSFIFDAWCQCKKMQLCKLVSGKEMIFFTISPHELKV